MSAQTGSFCRLESIMWQGFEAYLLDNGLVRAVVVPALGGKLASLLHVPSGREWLWRNPHVPVTQPTFGDPYVVRHDVGGFDECFPSVSATRYPSGPWEGTPVPDHGELWALPWRAEPFCDGTTIELRMAVHGVRFPYRFERAIFLAENASTLRLAYSVTNPTPFPFPFIWSAHPVFQVAPGMKIVAPVRDVVVHGSAGDRFGRLGTPQRWPELKLENGRLRDLSTMPEPGEGLAVKVWGRSPSQGFVALQDPASGHELRMQFDPADVTHLGMWLNYGGWSGAPGVAPYYNVAIEPCIGAQDDLALAVNHFREFATLPASGRRTWQLDLIMK